MKLPSKGMGKDELLRTLESFKEADLDWKSGRVFGYVYDPGREALEVGKQAYMSFLTENGLDFTSFPSLLKIETDLISLAATHLNGDEEVVGNFSSGGTESIIMAVKAARDYCRRHKPHIIKPEMILPVTAHAAFHKAASYLGIEVVPCNVNPQDFRADPNKTREKITENTILMVASAPSYAHGVVDPIPELASLAEEHSILFHVDACVGGFLLPYFRRLGSKFPDFDFSVPGVTSISMDWHKYAYSAKGASMVLYRNKEIREHQIFACARWTGYSIVNAAVQSSKSGGPMAGAWAALHFIGDEGYQEIARLTMEATQKLMNGISKIDGLRLMTRPDFCMFSFTSESVSVFKIVDEMTGRGWYVQPQLAYGDSRENIHLSVGVNNIGWVDAFLGDLTESVEIAKGKTTGPLAEMLSAQLKTIDPAALTDRHISDMMNMAGLGGEGGRPGGMAEINEIMNILPPELRERLLTLFVNMVFRRKA